MQELSRTARIYIIAMLMLGVVAFGYMARGVSPDMFQHNCIAFLGLTVLAAFAQMNRINTPRFQTYSTTLSFFFAAVLMLPMPLLALMTVIAFIPELIRLRMPWFIQAFNIAAFLCQGAISSWIITHTRDSHSMEVVILGGVAAATFFVLFNHVLMALVLKLARGVRIKDSGLFSWDNLITDATLICVGTTIALSWWMNHWSLLVSASPLVLIHRSLDVPNLKEEARTDPKTNLYNMKYFAEAIGEEYRRAERYDRPMSVIMADMDLLRNVNNTYGHLAGDTVLGGLADVMRECTREYDVPARFGGEEFAILLPNATSAEAMEVAERIRETFAARQFEVSTSVTPISATLSLGVASYPDHGDAPNEIVHQADLAVYWSKIHGRNRSHIASLESKKLAGLRLAEGSGMKLLQQIEGEQDEAKAAPHQPVSAPESLPNASPKMAPVLISLPPTKIKPERASTHDAPASPSSDLPASIITMITLTTAAALLAIIPLVAGFARLDWGTIAVLCALAVLAELLPISLYERGTVSVSVTAVLATIYLSGPSGGIIVAIVAALGAAVLHRSPLNRAIFNVSTLTLAAAGAGYAYHLINLPLTRGSLLYMVIPALVAATVNYGINMGLLAWILHLVEGRSPWDVWRERFQWLLPHYLVLGGMGLLMAVSYHSLGVIGLVAFAAPPLMMRFAMKQVVDRTAGNVSRLKAMNEQLTSLNEQLSRSNREEVGANNMLLEAVANGLETYAASRPGHATRVAIYATAVAETMGLPADRIELIRRAALLHDIGVVGIPQGVLDKRGRLSPEEVEMMKMHPVLGATMMEPWDHLRDLAVLVRHHHERFNGTGYPEGLSGEAIPLEDRILALCDAVDSMTSERPYRSSKSFNEIVAEIRACAGTQFDSIVVQAFLSVLDANGPSWLFEGGDAGHEGDVA